MIFLLPQSLCVAGRAYGREGVGGVGWGPNTSAVRKPGSLLIIQYSLVYKNIGGGDGESLIWGQCVHAGQGIPGQAGQVRARETFSGNYSTNLEA
jgi:hypothetical protein